MFTSEAGRREEGGALVTEMGTGEGSWTLDDCNSIMTNFVSVKNK